MLTFSQYIREFVETETEYEPKFTKMSSGEIAKKGKVGESLHTDRFEIRPVDIDNEDRMYTVHDKHSGEHVGTVRGTKVAKGYFRVDEVTKQKGVHPKMMHEVYNSILNSGTSMMSSGSISRKAHKVWKDLQGSGRQVDYVKTSFSGKKMTIHPTQGGTNVEPDFNKHVEKMSANKMQNAKVYRIKAK